MARTSQAFAILLMVLAAHTGHTAAFCVYNTGKTPATFFAWPPAAQTFKAVVQPGQSSCCNWQNPTCFAKDEGNSDNDPLAQCAPVTFYVAGRELDTGDVTSKFIEKKVLDILAPLVGGLGAILAPFTGGASIAATIGVVTAMESVGLGIADAVDDTGIPFEQGDVFQAGINGGSVTWDGQKASAGSVSACSGRKLQLF